MYTIYLIEDHRNKPYIGVTKKSPESRLKDHKVNARQNIDTHLYRAMRKYGEDRFDVIPLDVCTNKNEAFKLEKKWISQLGTYEDWGYNMTPGGEGQPSGEEHPLSGIDKEDHPMYGKRFSHTEDAKKRMSESSSGKNNPMYGKERTISKETKKKMSEANRGENHPNTKLSDDEAIRMIIEYRTTDKTYQDLGDKYDVYHTNVYKINNGINRGYLQDEIKNKMSEL